MAMTKKGAKVGGVSELADVQLLLKQMGNLPSNVRNAFALLAEEIVKLNKELLILKASNNG